MDFYRCLFFSFFLSILFFLSVAWFLAFSVRFFPSIFFSSSLLFVSVALIHSLTYTCLLTVSVPCLLVAVSILSPEYTARKTLTHTKEEEEKAHTAHLCDAFAVCMFFLPSILLLHSGCWIEMSECKMRNEKQQQYSTKPSKRQIWWDEFKNYIIS